jgi:hypothetical protein
MKFSRAISRVSTEMQSEVSGTVSTSIINVHVMSGQPLTNQKAKGGVFVEVQDELY